MGILEMTYVSYFFVIMAFAFGAAAVFMFFALDIRRCWRIVRGRHYAYTGNALTFDACSNMGIRSSEKTQKLVSGQTQALLPFEETVPLEPITLVQDIVMMGVDRL